MKPDRDISCELRNFSTVFHWGRAKMLTLKTTKPKWCADRVIYELTMSFGECGACQLVG
ncbi:hypothetical protein C1H46_009414 [Malus baccata]|uniref:Uncharacterized protein n=1 Tax=Malus baccata TaxID=106549 RepID=A0A540N320_MALBA|nr:hypothetical protein C1H46_009414 [Malus baccata]